MCIHAWQLGNVLLICGVLTGTVLRSGVFYALPQHFRGEKQQPDDAYLFRIFSAFQDVKIFTSGHERSGHLQVKLRSQKGSIRVTECTKYVYILWICYLQT